MPSSRKGHAIIHNQLDAKMLQVNGFELCQKRHVLLQDYSLRELFSTMDLDCVELIQIEDLVNQAKAELVCK